MTRAPTLVIDSSAALALVLADEEGEGVRALIAETVAANGQLHVPELFWYEVGNGLRTAELRRRISVDDVDAAAAALRDLPFVGSSAAAAETARAIGRLAQQHSLTYYDAAYLHLDAPLKTFATHLLQLRGMYRVIL